MSEMHVSASDFRVHLKDYLNQIAEGGLSVVVVRHGFNMGVMVGLQEYRAFEKWKRKQKGEFVVPDGHPDDLPIEEVERIYKETAKATDEPTLWWRGQACMSIRLRTGRYPDGGPPS